MPMCKFLQAGHRNFFFSTLDGNLLPLAHGKNPLPDFPLITEVLIAFLFIRSNSVEFRRKVTHTHQLSACAIVQGTLGKAEAHGRLSQGRAGRSGVAASEHFTSNSKA